MTKDMKNPRWLVEKTVDADLLHTMIGFVSEKLMELEVSAKAPAVYGQKNAERLAERWLGSSEQFRAFR